MKTRILIIIATITISLLGYMQYVDALCMENQDWLDAPCYGCIGCYPGLEQEKLDWAPYYDYKGSTWMDAKKQQLETAIKNNALREWFEQNNTGAHKNVHQYYFLQGDIPNIYGMNFAEALGFEISWNAVKDNSPEDPLLLWNYHDVILDGTLIETDLAVTVEGDHVPLYHIKANKYFKGEKNSDMITAVENPDDLEFHLFENGLFYLKKLENQNWYTATIVSAKTFGNCDARDLIEISPVLPNEKPPISMPANPAAYIDLCVPDYYDVDPDKHIFEDESLIPEPEQDRSLGENCGSGTVLEEGICVEETVNSTMSSGQWETVQSEEQKSVLDVIPSPLKQMKMGIKLVHVICDKDKYPVWNTHYKPACVYPDTESELLKRGWAKLRLMLPAGPDPIKELDWTGKNVMSMMLEGTFSFNSTPVETFDEKRAAVWEYSQQYHPGEEYLEYAIISHQNHYDVGDKVQFDLLEWGNYSGCWDVKLGIIDNHDQPVFESNSGIVCHESDETFGTFNMYSMIEKSYSTGGDFEMFVCDKPGYYRIEVSNGDVFFPTILQNFVCLESESEITPPPEPESSHSIIEVHCFPNQIIYNDECIYVLAPTDEFPEGMTKYFSMVDDKIINFCEIKTATSDGENTSGVTLDRCFEISHYTISDINVIDFQSTTPPTWISIKIEDLPRNIELGSSPTFKVIESGWGNPCTNPTLEVYHMKQEIGNDHTVDDLISKHRIVYSCPWYEVTYPPPEIFRVWDESDFTDFPICETQGRFLIIGDSGYERITLEEYYCGVKNEN